MSFVAKNHPQQVQKRGSIGAVDDRGTPWDLLEECRALAGVGAFTLDPAASPENTKAPFFFTEEDDGLVKPWEGTVWVNPPYSNISAWVEKAFREAPNCEAICLLLPANRTEQRWWHEWIEPARLRGHIRVYFLEKRRRFDRPDWEVPKKGDRPPFGLCLVVL